MFSTMQNQKRAEELIEDARNMLVSIDEKFQQAKERLEKKTAEIDAIRSRLIKQTLAKLKKRFEKIENENPIELSPVAEAPFSEQLQPLFEKSDIEPVAVKDVRGGKGGAFFGSLFATLVTLAVILAIGAIGTGQPLSPETFTDPAHLEKILTWLSGGAFNPHMGNPLFGAIGLGIAAIAAWMITWSIMMGKAAKRNLEVAEETYNDAVRYHKEKSRYIEAIETLIQELDQFEKILETGDIYMQEFNAVLQRILHTEGVDYTAYRNASKETVDRAAECAEALVPLLNIAIVTTEGMPSKQLSNAITHGNELILALVEERPLPATEALEASEEEATVESEHPEMKNEEGTGETEEMEKAETAEEKSLEIETKEEPKII